MVTIDTILKEYKGAVREAVLSKLAKEIETIITDYNIDPAVIGYRREILEDFLKEHCSGLEVGECLDHIEELVIRKGGRKILEKKAEELEDYIEYLSKRYSEIEKPEEAPQAVVPSLDEFIREIRVQIMAFLEDMLSRIGEGSKEAAVDAIIDFLRERINPPSTALREIREKLSRVDRFVREPEMEQRINTIAEEAQRIYKSYIEEGRDPIKASELTYEHIARKYLDPYMMAPSFKYTIWGILKRSMKRNLTTDEESRTQELENIFQLKLKLKLKPPPTPTPTPTSTPTPSPSPTPTPTPTPTRARPVLTRAIRSAAASAVEFALRSPKAVTSIEVPPNIRTEFIAKLPVPPPIPTGFTGNLIAGIYGSIMLKPNLFILSLFERGKPLTDVDAQLALRPREEDVYDYVYPYESLFFFLGWLNGNGFEIEVSDACLNYIGEYYPVPYAGYLFIGFIPVMDPEAFSLVKRALDVYDEFATNASAKDIERESKDRSLSLFIDTMMRIASLRHDIAPILSTRYLPFVRQLSIGIPGVEVGVARHFRKAVIYTCGEQYFKELVNRYRDLKPIITYHPITPPRVFQSSSALLSGINIDRAPPGVYELFLRLVDNFTKPPPDRDPRYFSAAVYRLPPSYAIPFRSLYDVIYHLASSGVVVKVDEGCSELVGEIHGENFHVLYAAITDHPLSLIARQAMRFVIYPPAKLFRLGTPVPAIIITLQHGQRTAEIKICGRKEVRDVVRRVAVTAPILPPPVTKPVTIAGVTFYARASAVTVQGSPPKGSEPWLRYISSDALSVIARLNHSGYRIISYEALCPDIIGDRGDIEAYVITPLGAQGIRVVEDHGTWARIAPLAGIEIIIADKRTKTYTRYSCR